MAISLDDAVARVRAACAPRGVERVPLDAAAGRVPAADVVSSTDLPRFTNAAMDGVAVRAADTAAAPVTLRLSSESRAGRPADRSVGAGAAARISTGAAMPDGADAVVRIEDVRIEGDIVRITSAVPAGHDVRPAGDDVRRGQVVVPAGVPLGAGEIGMLAAVGCADVAVRPRPRVAIVATGDELVPPGESLGPGQIHDSNSSMIARMATDAGAHVVHVARRVADTRPTTDAAVAEALAVADVVLCLGGVSMGEHDHVKPALRAAGVDEVFWQVALRPGHPTWFGVRDGGDSAVRVFGLPGNPGSAFITFHLFVVPALDALRGRTDGPLETTATFRGPAQRVREGADVALRVRLSGGGEGLVAHATGGNQRSHAMSALVGVDALALIPPPVSVVADGDAVRVRLLR